MGKYLLTAVFLISALALLTLSNSQSKKLDKLNSHNKDSDIPEEPIVSSNTDEDDRSKGIANTGEQEEPVDNLYESNIEEATDDKLSLDLNNGFFIKGRPLKDTIKDLGLSISQLRDNIEEYTDEVFNKMDKNKDQVISLEELTHTIEGLFQRFEVPQSLLERDFISEADKDLDQKINREEFKNFIIGVLVHAKDEISLLYGRQEFQIKILDMPMNHFSNMIDLNFGLRRLANSHEEEVEQYLKGLGEFVFEGDSQGEKRLLKEEDSSLSNSNSSSSDEERREADREQARKAIRKVFKLFNNEVSEEKILSQLFNRQSEAEAEAEDKEKVNHNKVLRVVVKKLAEDLSKQICNEDYEVAEFQEIGSLRKTTVSFLRFKKRVDEEEDEEDEEDANINTTDFPVTSISPNNNTPITIEEHSVVTEEKPKKRTGKADKDDDEFSKFYKLESILINRNESFDELVQDIEDFAGNNTSLSEEEAWAALQGFAKEFNLNDVSEDEFIGLFTDFADISEAGEPSLNNKGLRGLLRNLISEKKEQHYEESCRKYR
mmetsp:Transcript_5914/g.6108  ORF Transcript_5914/g.6108 Transcript_5914/m.6108 type:complete len:547 (+) Transcript_5914:76-1716(+)